MLNTVDYAFSRETASLQRSVMRDLLRLTTDPSIISLAGGLPPPDYLPLDAFQESLNTVLRRDGGRALQYSPQHSELRAWISNYMESRGIACTPEQVFITNGNQQGLNILSRLFLDPGDRAVTEAITFTGIQQATAGRGAHVLAVPTDLQTGVDVDALEEAFTQSPRLAVLITDFHNPLGVSLSPEKRVQIADLAARYRVPVVEDDPYSPLRFAGETTPPVKAYDEAGYVFYLGSFSKMLAPAARLGWMVAPTALIPKITVVRESIDLESSALIQRTVYDFLSRGLLDDHLTRLNAALRERCAAMLNALETHFGGWATWTKPEGGLFIWLTLPEYIDTWRLFEDAVRQGVAYVPGSAFAVEGGYRNTMRLNFSAVAPDKIHEGLARLAAVLRQ
ncbi:MAG: PLP-dependent aminotransferase family protein [bacterium]|nr:PLP-dependent aminotransferase family protein [bacterium]